MLRSLLEEEAQPRPSTWRSTRVAIVTFDGFNELDSFIALGLLNRPAAQGWTAEITGPGHRSPR